MAEMTEGADPAVVEDDSGFSPDDTIIFETDVFNETPE